MKKILFIIIPIVVVGVALFYFLQNVDTNNDAQTNTAKTMDKNMETEKMDVDINQDYPTANERFGFLIGPGPEELQSVRKIGAAWARPHPGAFVWGDMQRSATSEIDFTQSDKVVQSAQSVGVHILVTLWHYAEWDQEQRTDVEDCIASTSEFVEEFGKYRCAPYNMDAYATWVSAVVERYDGDGVEDMPDLTQPITHWEVMNEPDLATPDGSPGLQFLIGEPEDYIVLLKATSSAIRVADPNAKILIAGAAGGNSQFLDYYRKVFADSEIKNMFDIANVHCISSGDVDSFNVKPYAALLKEFEIDKPICG